MSIQVTLNLPSESYERAKYLANLMERSITDVLSDTLQHFLSPLPVSQETSKPVSTLSNKEILALAELQLPPEKDKHLSALLYKQQAGELTGGERAELFSFMHLYQEGLLRKAHALREAVQRGLREPLTS